MTLLAARFAQEGVIKRLHRRVLVRASERPRCIGLIERGGPLRQQRRIKDVEPPRRIGLPASPDAPARTGHYFNDVVLTFAADHAIQQCFRVDESIRHPHRHGLVADGNISFA